MVSSRCANWALAAPPMIAAVLLWPSLAWADAGIPMLALISPASWALFIPVVAVEAHMAKRMLGLGSGRAIGLVAAANLVSTVVGIPLTWVLATALEMGFAALTETWSWNPFSSGWLEPLLAPAWLGPGAKTWTVVAAALVLCGPFFLASVWVEQKLLRHWQPAVPAGRVKHWAWWANATTYGLIVLGLAVMLVVVVVGGQAEAAP